MDWSLGLSAILHFAPRNLTGGVDVAKHNCRRYSLTSHPSPCFSIFFALLEDDNNRSTGTGEGR